MPSLNPARSLGPSFVLSRWDSHWVCWVGGLGGGVASALLHEWGSRRGPRGGSSRASSPRDLDELDKPTFPSHAHYRHAPTYCAASVPRPDTTEPLYSGTKSLYCRSPPPARHGLHRSQSVYSKGSSATSAAMGTTNSVTAGNGGPLVGAQSLVLRPPHTHAHHALAHNQNAHNSQRDPPYGTANGVRPGPAGAAAQTRRDSVYSGSTGGTTGASVTGMSVTGAGNARRGGNSMEESAYGTYGRGGVGAAAPGGMSQGGMSQHFRAPHTPTHGHEHY